MFKNFTAKLRPGLTFVAGGLVAICGYWNTFTSYRAESEIPPRESNDIVLTERRLQPIRASLLNAEYRGAVGFIGLQDLQGLPWSSEDRRRWGQAQYVMLPWMLVHGERSTPFILADFSDERGPDLPGFSRFYDDGKGLVLFRKQLP